jgi:anaerobic selenocysteine-containing dehydrogenase
VSLSSLLLARTGPYTEELERGRAASRAPDATVRSVCGFCSTGCGLDVHVAGGRAIGVTPAPGYPVNLGMACPKGWEAHTPLGAPDRATRPLLRDARGKRVPVSWDEAMRVFVTRMRAVQAAHGPESVAFLSTGQITTEEMALLGVLAKFGMGVVHGDGNTRQCMATAVTAYKESFGFDAPPYTYADFEQSDVIVLWGSNLCIAHPVLWQRICANPHKPTILVVDPRATETAMAATRHLAVRPKRDLILAYAVARELIERGWIDRAFIDAHVSGYDAFARGVEPWTLERAAEATGLSADDIAGMAAAIHAGRRVSFWWTMGVNQSHEGVRTAQAIIALALLTGNIGRPGTGANSITGQCNAMGSRMFSNTSSLLGGRDFANPEHRAEVASVLGIDPARIPSHAGRAYDRILSGVLTGDIRALWIIGTNPAHSWIDQSALDEIFARLDFVVVQDMYATTETARKADLILPAAAWGEKDGTFINSERRIGRIRRAATPPGEALPDFEIFQRVAAAWGADELVAAWRTPADAFALLKRLSAGRPCDFTGVDDHAMLEAQGGVQWPHPAGAPPPAAERRLFADGRFFTPDGRARLIVDQPQPPPEPPSTRYPFLLNTGRGSSSQWHTQTRTAKSAVLRELSPRAIYVEINPADARRLGIAPDELVTVASRRGDVIARAFVTTRVVPGEVFVPMHFAEANRLTIAAFDPHSRQPAYKASAVNVTRIDPVDRAALSGRRTR